MYDSTTRRHERFTKVRFACVVYVLLSIAIGRGCKKYVGPGQDWVNNWGPASVAYELMFVFLLFFVWPNRSRASRIAIGVFLGTCTVEFLQLWHTPWLDAVRSTPIGRLLLGNTFSWWDFPAYAIGSTAGWLALTYLPFGFKKSQTAHSPNTPQAPSF